MNIYFLTIIIVYLLYSYIKSRPSKKNKEKVNEYEKIVVAAVIAKIIGEEKNVIKRIFVVGKIEDKKSAWKMSGRQESMIRSNFIR